MLNLRPPVFGRPGHDPQVLRHLELAADIRVAAITTAISPAYTLPTGAK